MVVFRFLENHPNETFTEAKVTQKFVSSKPSWYDDFA